MRIIIEFEGTEATVKKEQAGAFAAQALGVPTTSTELALPGGLAAAAAGALNAGPAPSVATQVSGMPTTSTELAPQGGLAAAAAGALSAGPAPSVATQAPGVPPLPLSMSGPSAPVDGADGLPAGAAPNPSF